MNYDKYTPPFPRYPEYMNGRLKKIDMESRLLKVMRGIDDGSWYPEWNSEQRWAAKAALSNALDILEEFDY